jgi:hypothetical protein
MNETLLRLIEKSKKSSSFNIYLDSCNNYMASVDLWMPKGRVDIYFHCKFFESQLKALSCNH